MLGKKILIFAYIQFYIFLQWYTRFNQSDIPDTKRLRRATKTSLEQSAFACFLLGKRVQDIDKLVNLDRLQYTCTSLRRHWDAKRGEPYNGQMCNYLGIGRQYFPLSKYVQTNRIRLYSINHPILARKYLTHFGIFNRFMFTSLSMVQDLQDTELQLSADALCYIFPVEINDPFWAYDQC